MICWLAAYKKMPNLAIFEEDEQGNFFGTFITRC